MSQMTPPGTPAPTMGGGDLFSPGYSLTNPNATMLDSMPPPNLVPGVEPCTAANPMGMGDPSHGQVMSATPEPDKPPPKKKCPTCDAEEAKRKAANKACMKGVAGSAAIGAAGGAIGGAATGPGAALGAAGGAVAGGGIAYYTLPECGPGGTTAWYQAW